MKIFFATAVILALSSAALASDASFEDLVANQFHEEYVRLTANGHRSVRDLTRELVSEGKNIGHSAVTYGKSLLGIAPASRVKRSPDDAAADKNPLEGLVSGGLEALMKQLAAGITNPAAAPAAGSGDASTPAAEATTQASSDATTPAAWNDQAVREAAKAGGKPGALPLPLILIPGKPGPPGLPGLPGLPGKNGKLPNFKGLKAIVSAKVAKILALIAATFVGVIIKTLGLIGLVLGITLPIYGKLKTAGAVLPVPHDPYGKDAGIKISADAADKLAYDVLPQVGAGYDKYGRRRR